MAAFNWTSRTTQFIVADVNDVAYNGSDLWAICGGDGGDSQLSTSPNGIDWTLQTPGVAVGEWYKIAHNQIDMWMVVGGTFFGAGKLATSPDGINWTEQTIAVGGADAIFCVAYGNGRWIVCGGDIVGGSRFVSTSDDNGVTWVARGDPFSSGSILGIAYDGVSRWAISGSNGQISTSDNDGVTWTPRTSNITGVIRGISHNQTNLWVAVDTSTGIATSADGITWVAQVAPQAANSSIAYGGGYWLLGGTATYSSINATDWTLETGGHGLGVAYNGSDMWIVTFDSLLVESGVLAPFTPYTSDYDIGATRKTFWLNKIAKK